MAVIALVGVSAYAYWGTTVIEPQVEVSQETMQEFTDTLRQTFIEERGQPIEGFEPAMFMDVYVGLKVEDFDGVDALIGLYRAQNGEVVYDLNGEQELHSAARAISDEGMETLLINIASRLNIDIEEEGVLEDIFVELQKEAVTPEPAPVTPPVVKPPVSSGTEVTLVGSIVCLPHKGDGPHTLECAYGFRADNGNHYALHNLFDGPWPWHLDVGDRARVEGTLTAPAANEKYDIVGVIDVESSEKL